MYETEGMTMIETAHPDDAPRAGEPYEKARKAHAACMVCGEGRPGTPALGLRFVLDSAGGVQATFRTASRYQGYQGILHGGVISTLLDAAMVHCLFAHGVTAVTAEMTVRFLREVPVDCDVSVGATLIGERHGVFQAVASLSLAGTRLAMAKGKFCRSDQ
jgi:uncharacterized protein (TIGR00369 family)